MAARRLALATVLLLLAPAAAAPPEPPRSHAADQVLLTEVYGYASLADEFVALVNNGSAPANLTGWYLSDGEGTVSFPANFTLAPGQRIVLTANATAYALETLQPADFTWGTGNATVLNTSGSFALANTGDEVLLVDAAGVVVDAFVWGISTYAGPGWNDTARLTATRGQVFTRQVPGAWVDTNASADWDELRVRILGQSEIPFAPLALAGTVEAFASPGRALEVFQRYLDNATASLRVALYIFDSLALQDTLIAAIGRGVNVTVLLEGTPVGGMSDRMWGIATNLSAAGARVVFQTEENVTGYAERYGNHHAKYVVVDDRYTLVSSENWGDSGLPPNGTWGNRGWHVAVDNATLAAAFAALFDDDALPARLDTVEYANMTVVPTAYAGDPMQPFSAGVEPVVVSGTFNVTPVIGPEHTLRDDAILGLMRSATQRLYVEQFYAHTDWFGVPNLYLEEAIAAARRGVEVKVLLDSTWFNVDPNVTYDNDDTVAYVNAVAANESLNLEAKLIDLPAHGLLKVHNKGVVVDGQRVLVSSVNWNRYSPTRNREVGLFVEDATIASFFEDLFLWDWTDEFIPPVSALDPVAPYWHPTPVNVTATAADANSSVASVELWYSFSVDNASFGPNASFGVDAGAPFFWNFSFPAGPGHYRLHTTAADVWANAEAPPPLPDIQIGYDPLPPTSAVDPLGAYWFTGPVNLTATAADAHSGVALVDFYYAFSADNVSWGLPVLLGWNATPPYAAALPFTEGPGHYRVRTVATDAVGNVEAAPPFDRQLGRVNDPPTAAFGASLWTTWRGVSITFDASNSSDDFGIQAYRWNFGDGANATGALVSHAYTGLGSFSVRLTVEDIHGRSDNATAPVTIQNRGPTADAGPDQGVTKNVLVTLDGSASSDPDGDALNYSWTQTAGPAVTLSAPASASPTFTPAAGGNYTFELAVSDAYSGVASDSVLVTVANGAPVASAGADQGVPKRTLVTLSGGLSSDPDGDTLGYVWTQTAGPAVTLTGVTTATPTFVPPRAGLYTFALRVTDSEGLNDSDEVTVTATNTPPTVDAGADLSRYRGTTVTLTATAADADGDPITYAWTQVSGPTVSLTGASSATAVFTSSLVGDYEFRVAVGDGDGGSANDTVRVTLYGVAPTAALTADPLLAAVGSSVTFDGTGSSDSDGTLAEYRFDLGDGSVVAGTNPVAEHAYGSAGTYNATLTVTDSDGLTSAAGVTITVVEAVNRPPTAAITAVPASGDLSTLFSFDAAGSTDPDGDPLSFAWDFGDGGTGSGPAVTHAYSRRGAFTVTLTATDGRGGTDDATRTVVVANRAPAVVLDPPEGPLEVRAGRSLTFAASASDPDGDPVNYSWRVDGAPVAEGSLFDFTPDEPGTYAVTLVVSDGSSVETRSWTVQVSSEEPVAPGGLPWFLPWLVIGLVALVFVALLLLARRRRRPASEAPPPPPPASLAPTPPPVEALPPPPEYPPPEFPPPEGFPPPETPPEYPPPEFPPP